MNERAMEKPTNERLKEIIQGYRDAKDPSLLLYLSTLPEFNPPKGEWIKCKDRMPKCGEDVDLMVVVLTKAVPGWRSSDCKWRTPKAEYSDKMVSHWMPRHVPAPPVKVDSELVKEIKTIACPLCTDSCQWTVDKVLEIVMRHEKKRALEEAK